MTIDRRRFIGLSVGAAAGTALGWQVGGVAARVVAGFDRPVYPPGGPEGFALSVCKMCPGGCGIRVRTVAGRPVKVDGNPLHPVSQGSLCPKGQAALQSLYHPDRLQTPLRRIGPRGSSSSFRPATWDEALEEIAVRLTLLRRQQRPEALVLLRGAGRGVDARIARRFMSAFGSPNDVELPTGSEAAAQALELTQGVRAVPTYDLQSSEYVLSFGGALLEAWDAPVYTMRAYGEFRQGRPGRRGKLVHVEPRLSITGSLADEWVAVRPGTEGLLAMGVASALVAEELYDKEFIARRCHQFEDSVDSAGAAQEGLRQILLREFSLERVSAETGVSVNRILELAREFAAARPGIAVASRRGQLLPGNLFDHMAAQVLNALVGNVDSPGGVLVPEPTPLQALAQLPADPVSAEGLARERVGSAREAEGSLLRADVEDVAEAILSDSPYRAECVVVLDGDPAFSTREPEALASALEHVPLVVSIAALPGDTSLLADWVLPQAHFLESWNLETTPPGVPFPVASLAAPVLPRARHDSRSAGSILLELARRIGGPMAEALPWADPPALIRAEVKGLFEARRGAVMGTPFDEAWVRLMERAGWWAPGYQSESELWARMKQSGGWWDPFYDHWDWSRVFRTESGRFEFRPEELRELARVRRLRSRVIQAEGSRQPAAERRLALHLFEPLSLSGGGGAELPFLQNIVDPIHEQRWTTWVELNPHTADELGVEDRSWVQIIAPFGRIRVRALHAPGVVPGVAAVPIGLGHEAGGRWARGVGANPLHLLSSTREPLSGLPDPGAVLVRVVPEGRHATSETYVKEA